MVREYHSTYIDTLEGPPCPDPENLWPWYSDPDGTIPIWKETYKEWNIWHLAEVGAVYGITTPECVAYSQSTFDGSITGARTRIDGLAEELPFTTIIDFVVPDSLPEGSDVNVSVLLKNTGGSSGYLSYVIDGNPNTPDDYITMETGSTYLAPGNSRWIDIYFRYDKMPNWNFNVIARNYEGTSYISKTINLEAPDVGIPTTLTINVPDSVNAGVPFTVYGKLYVTATGIRIPEMRINLSYNGKSLGYGYTDPQGDYFINVSINERGIWTIKAEFPGVVPFATSSAQENLGIDITAIDPLLVVTSAAILAAILVRVGLSK